jgi:hypothetical protein
MASVIAVFRGSFVVCTGCVPDVTGYTVEEEHRCVGICVPLFIEL